MDAESTQIAPETYLPQLIEIAARAGEAIVSIYQRPFDVQYKHDASPVTEADLAAHTLIINALEQLTPSIPILSEEQLETPFEERRQWQRYWLIDPLDGTREFINHNDEFTVNIALIEGHSAILGVIHVPVSGDSYYASLGHGAFKRSPDSNEHKINVRQLSSGPVVVAGSRSHRGERLTSYLQRIGEHQLIPMGSALKSCKVAEGEADLYARFGPTSEWDTAAAQIIVEEAGGRFTDTTMQPLRYNTKESLINPHFFVFGDTSRDWSSYL